MKQQAVIIVAGGVGERAGAGIPKQFVSINNKPIICYSIEKFLQFNTDIKIILVVHKDFQDMLKEILKQFFPDYQFEITVGGNTRFQSVKNGLMVLKDLGFFGIVAIHDAARPFISEKLIERCFSKATQCESAIPIIPVTDSIRLKIGKSTKQINRDDVVIVQTPQCFEFNILYRAFQTEYQPLFTDEATVLEHFGKEIHIVEGEKNNFKITNPIDFEIAKLLF